MQINPASTLPRFGSRYTLKQNEGGYVPTTSFSTEYFMELTQRKFHIGIYQDFKQGQPLPSVSTDIYGIALGNEADLVVDNTLDARLEKAFEYTQKDAARFGVTLTLSKVPASAPIQNKTDYALAKQTMVDEYKAASKSVPATTAQKGTIVYREQSDFTATDDAGQTKLDYFLTSGKIPQFNGL